jgi:TusE/DsrC/DsvC family sulfur relay protein
MRLESQQTTATNNQAFFMEIEGRTIATDPMGFLLDSLDWSAAVAEAMAVRDGLKLEADHWIVINFLRMFFDKYGVAPDLYMLQRNLCKHEGDCRWDKAYLKQLFLQDSTCACRYAGLPQPNRGVCG